jgi:hypothetical protein
MPRPLIACAIALALIVRSIPAQDTARVADPGTKSPTTARVIGIVPGAGHVYAGEPLRGLGFFAATTASIGLAALMAAVDCIEGLQPSCEDLGYPATVTLVTGLVTWGFSIFDAGRAARRTNARRPQKVSLILAPASAVPAHANRERVLNLGLSVSLH